MQFSVRIDNKHSIVADCDEITMGTIDLYVAKRHHDGHLERIPPEEPTILFRGRDRLAVSLLLHYRTLCMNDGCNSHQLETLDGMLRAFVEFAITHPGTMKQPGITRGH